MLKYTIFIFTLAVFFTACSRKSSTLPTKSDNTNSVSIKFWMISTEKSEKLPCNPELVIPSRYRLAEPDTLYVFNQLTKSTGFSDSIDVQVPMANGSILLARLARSASVPLEFASKYGILAFSGRILELQGSTVRLESDPTNGIRLMSISDYGTTIMYRVCRQGPWSYMVFDKNDLPPGSKIGFE